MRRALGRLSVRTYAFALTTVIASVIVLFGTVKLLGGPRWKRPQAQVLAALGRQLGERYADEAALVAALPDATRGLSGQHAVYDRGGARVWAGPGSPPAAPTAGEWRTLDRGGVVIDDDRLVVLVPGAAGLALIEHADRAPPLGPVVLAISTTAALILLLSIWFARGIVRPLRRLERAAIALGDGDTAARSGVTRPGELGAVGRAFDGMADRVDHLLRVQRELLADISHELRTPLARIRVALDLVTEDPTAAADVLGEVGLDLAEIDQIVDDLFMVVRLDQPSAAARLQEGSVVVGELIGKARDRFAQLHPRRALDVAGAADVVVRGHGALLRRALDNLLDNAAKYSSPDAPIVLAARAADAEVVLEVIDRGIGMSPDEVASAFTPFWRADGSRSRGTGGVGLGLALARRIVRAHGGDITVRSTPGAGTTAALSIPRPAP